MLNLLLLLLQLLLVMLVKKVLMVEILLLVRGDTSRPPYGIILSMVSSHYLCLDHFTNKNTLYFRLFFRFFCTLIYCFYCFLYGTNNKLYIFFFCCCILFVALQTVSVALTLRVSVFHTQCKCRKEKTSAEEIWRRNTTDSQKKFTTSYN